MMMMKMRIVLLAGLAFAGCKDPTPATPQVDAGSIADAHYAQPDAFVRNGPMQMACMHTLAGFSFGPSGMGVDGAGNIYVAGVFTGTVDFDPGPGVMIEQSATQRYFVLRINRDCTLGWVRPFEPSLIPGFYVRFTVDRAGNSYLYSHFRTEPPNGMADFDFTSGTDLRVANFGDDLFITALGPAGEYRFTRWFGDTGYERPTSISVDTAGDVYFAGIFQGVVDFDFVEGPMARAVLHAGGSTTDAPFVAAIRGDGSFGWAHHTSVLVTRLDPGPAGFISAVGTTSSTIDVDFGAGVDSSAPYCGGAGCVRGFHALISRDGLFGRATYSPAGINGGFIGVRYDAVGRSYAAGQFAGQFPVDFDDGPAQSLQQSKDSFPGPTGLLPYEPFVRRTSATGGFDWVHHPQASQSTGSLAASLTQDVALGPDAVYVVGCYAGALIDGDTFDTTVASGFDPFIYSLDLEGNVRWGLGFEADDPVDTLYLPIHVDVADDGRVTVVGQIKGSLDLDLTDGVHQVTGPTTYLVTFDPLDCRERAERPCDCGDAMRGVQTCSTDGRWEACTTCAPVTPPTCVASCASPAPVCGAIANGCFAALECDACPGGAACTNPAGCPLPAPTELAGGLDHPTTIVVDATDVYVLVRGAAKTEWFAELSPVPVPPTPDRRILRIPKSGAAAQVLAVGPGLAGPVQDARYVYWSDGIDIVRYDKLGTAPAQQLIAGVYPIALAIEGTQLAFLGYVLPAGATRVYLYDSVSGFVDSGRDSPGLATSTLAMDATHVYVAVPAPGLPSTGMIYRLLRSGGPYEAFGTAHAPTQMAIDATHVYYVSTDPSAALFRRPKDQSFEERVSGNSGFFGFGGLALGNGVVYVTELGAASQSTWEGTVLEFDKTTFERRSRARLLDHPAGIAFDGTALFVAESGPTSQTTTRGRVLRVP